MTTSQTPFLAEIVSEGSIPLGKRAYFQERTRQRLYDFIVGKFLVRAEEGFTQADLARRIGRKPEQINRWLAAPGNLTIETISDLLLGIAAEELEPHSSSLLSRAPRNDDGAQWLVVEARTQSAPSNATPVVHLNTPGEAHRISATSSMTMTNSTANVFARTK